MQNAASFGAMKSCDFICVADNCKKEVCNTQLCLCKRHYIEHVSMRKKNNVCVYCKKPPVEKKHTCIDHDPYKDKVAMAEARVEYIERTDMGLK